MANQQSTSVRVLQSGPMSLIQDRGRVGYQQLGVSVSGAVDVESLDIANRLVGNEVGAACLEVLLGGLIIEFSDQSVFALTGAETNATVDGVPVSVGVSYLAHTGAKLELGMASQGLRSYLAIAGGIDSQTSLGSRSTHVASAIGGFEGRALADGDVYAIGQHSHTNSSGLLINEATLLIESGELEVRVILGPQQNEFTSGGIETLLTSSYVVTDQSNRQGLRLDGPEIESASGSFDIVSDPVVNGSIQIPGDGKPIVLLADRQTTGGYAKIATVATIDLPKLGQAKPGTTVRFTEISVQDAQTLLRTRNDEIDNSEPTRVVLPEEVKVNGAEVSVGLAENGSAGLAIVDGHCYPISVEEYTPEI